MTLKSDITNSKLVEFSTPDGLLLPGLLYEAKGSEKVVVYLHGNGSSSVFYDEKEHRDLPGELNKKGISFLKFNNRGAHIIKKINVKKGTEVERLKYGCAFEVIKECVFDIDGAVKFLQGLGYKEFYLMGASTGANKICVYNHYKPQNAFKKYILICGGDDTGIYYFQLGDKKFWKLLEESKEMIAKGNGEDLIKSLLPNEIFSYKGFYDIADPDGDYNCFPFAEALGKAKLSQKPLFRYFKEIKTPSLVVYGEKDEYAWGDAKKAAEILKELQPNFSYQIIKDADHGFTGKSKELSEVISKWI
jgi:pimeloyl-ACP methyl ester carboxylesterase